LNRLFFYIRLYGLLVGQYIKTRMQYRFDFFISTLAMLMFNASALLSLWIIMSNLKNLAGWSYEELVFMYSFSVIAQLPLQIIFDHIWSLRMHVNQGTFIKYYFKPIHSLFYYVSEMIDIKGFGQVFFGIAAMIWACNACNIEWNIARILLLPVMLFGSSLIFIALMLTAASMSFWIKDSFSILSFVSSFRDYARYPMQIYNAFFRIVFTWIIPIGFVAFYPSHFFLRDTPIDWLALMVPLVGIILFWLSVKVWHIGTRVWGGTGS
jgi:ABC-2 type transport system permease protein